MPENCLFCEVYEKKRGIIFENNYFYAMFDEIPVTPGHAEVVPKRHVGTIHDLTRKEWASLHSALKKTKRIIESTDLRELYNGFIRNPIDEKALRDKALRSFEKMLKHIGIGRNPDGYNFGVNEGEAAGRTIPHLHIHIIPRYLGDVDDPRGGIRNIFPGMGNYLK